MFNICILVGSVDIVVRASRILLYPIRLYRKRVEIEALLLSPQYYIYSGRTGMKATSAANSAMPDVSYSPDQPCVSTAAAAAATHQPWHFFPSTDLHHYYYTNTTAADTTTTATADATTATVAPHHHRHYHHQHHFRLDDRLFFVAAVLLGRCAQG